jgi:uncharacterized protein YjiS (DUF1127 family)
MPTVHGWRNETAIFLRPRKTYVASQQEPGAPRHEDAALDPDGCQFGSKTMSSLTTKDQFAFELPNLTYVDASLEEANFRTPVQPSKPRGFSALFAAFRAWRERQAAIAELEMMSDHELADIGLNRADVHRVFDDAANQDLRDRAFA